MHEEDFEQPGTSEAEGPRPSGKRRYLFRVRNHHASVPDIPSRYFETASFLAVFENIFGEQWVFTWRHGQEYGVLWGGDVDWSPDKMYGPRPSRWLLSDEEALWATTCWFTAAQSHHPVEAVRHMVHEVGPLTYLHHGGFVARDRERRRKLAAEWRADPATRVLVERYDFRAIREQHLARWREVEGLSEEDLKALKRQRDAAADEANQVTREAWDADGPSA